MVEPQKFAERGVCKVVDPSAAKLCPESVMLSVKWVITNKGSVEYFVFWHARAADCQELDLEGCHPGIVREEI